MRSSLVCKATGEVNPSELPSGSGPASCVMLPGRPYGSLGNETAFSASDGLERASDEVPDSAHTVIACCVPELAEFPDMKYSVPPAADWYWPVGDSAGCREAGLAPDGVWLGTCACTTLPSFPFSSPLSDSA